MIIDKLGRQFSNLRVSLTAACNFACSYCVPEGEKLLKARHELDADDLLYAVQLIKEVAGINKLRITGGEPLIAANFDRFMNKIPELSFTDVSITTNGQILERKIPIILQSGIKRLNVSLDSLEPEKFKAIARAGSLKAVLKGIEASLSAGLKLKINMVPMKDINNDQILPMLDFCLERGIELRFIELMRMGHLSNAKSYNRIKFSLEEILELINSRYDFETASAERDSTSIRYFIPNQKGYFGIIANDSAPFCQTCSRLRLSSAGYLHGCLSNTNRHYIGDLLSLPFPQAITQLQTRLTSVMADKQTKAFAGGATVMKFIGG